MSSFSGVSFVVDGRASPRPAAAASSSSTTTVTDSGYHLLVVDRYARTRDTTPNGIVILSRPFRVGGHRWHIKYYPNGELSKDADSISLFLCLDDESTTGTVGAQFGFSFVDEADNHALPSDICRTTDVVYSFSREGSSWGYCRFMERESLEKSAHIKGDSLTIRCDVVVVTKNVDIRSGAAAPLVAVPASDFSRHFTHLLRSGEGADVTFQVGGETFAAHSCVLVARSTAFKTELLAAAEEEGGIVRVHDMEPKAFATLLRFVYRDAAPEIGEEEEDGDVTWQHLLVAAHRYDLLRLRLICERKLCAYINASTVATILVLAEQHHCAGLKAACLDFLGSPSNLQEAMVAGGLFERLTSSCPVVLKELLIAMLVVSPKTGIVRDGSRRAGTRPFVVVPPSDLQRHLSGLLQSGEATDVTFQVGGETFAAHRCVLAARSLVFRAELFGPMKEGTAANSCVVRIDDMEPEAFRMLLGFIYGDSVPLEEEGDEKEPEEQDGDEIDD